MRVGVGVVIGRFHTDKLTEGHKALFREVCDRHDKVIVLLGVHPKLTTTNNPLDYASREFMLRDYLTGTYRGKDFLFAPIRDNARDDKWSRNVDKIVETLAGPFVPAVLYGGRDSFLPHYRGCLPTEHLSLQVDLTTSATSCRRKIHQTVLKTVEERRGAIWAAGNQWHRVTPCVDIALWRQNLATGEIEVLMGRKNQEGSGLWGFPGGHIDKIDSTAEDAAVRELYEETGAKVNSRDLAYICSRAIPDWRNVEGDTMWTTLYAVKQGPNVDSSRYKAADDLEEIGWVSLSKTSIEKITYTHQRLFTELGIYFEKMRGEHEQN